MARRYFADPHTLMKTQYSRTSAHTCDICSAELAGIVGYRCSKCDFDVHEACADYFKETVSFFAHPWHTLVLSRVPSGRYCDLCREDCPTGSFAYRCVQCGFDVHPLCTMLPQVIPSPLHRDHDLRMVPAWGDCGACLQELPVWHYRCGFCDFALHIECVNGVPSGRGQGSASRDDHHHQQQQGTAARQTSSGSQSFVATPSRRTRFRSVLKQGVFMAIESAAGELASQVLENLVGAVMN